MNDIDPFNPYYCCPKHVHSRRRSKHHDYTKAAKYMITLFSNPALPFHLSEISLEQDPMECRKVAVSKLTQTGSFAAKGIELWAEKFKDILRVEEFVIMPDHIHICVEVLREIPTGFSRKVAALMGGISTLRHDALPERHRQNPKLPFFDKGFNDRIALSREQWIRQIEYVRDNPRRYLAKKSNPDFMRERWKIGINGKYYMAKGNIFLLKEPILTWVKQSRHFTSEQLQAYVVEKVREIESGAIAVSPFIGPQENYLRKFALNCGYSYIKICENGFSERWSPSKEDFELMQQGRLLLISELKISNQKNEMSYTRATQLNKIAEEIVEAINSGATTTMSKIVEPDSFFRERRK